MITNEFYGKYDFLISLLFLIFSSIQINKHNQKNKEYQIYINLFLKKLKRENIINPLITILIYFY